MADEEEKLVEQDAPAPEADAPTQADEVSGAPAAKAPAAPVEVLAPKERRQRARSAKAAATPTRAPSTPEERQTQRDTERRRKAVQRRSRRLRERERAREMRAKASPSEPLPSLRPERNAQQKTRQGIVVSDRAAKTITVRIDVTRRHPRYDKVVRRSSTLHAHDERGEAHIGDTVVVTESRPLSRTKRWRLVEVVERAR